MKKKLLPFLIILITGLNSYSSHYAGGNLYYDCLGNNQYKFWAEVTLDCYQISSASPSIPLTTYNSCNYVNYTVTLSLVNTAGDNVSQICGSKIDSTSCGTPKGTLPGRMRFLYSSIVTLQPCDSWTFGLGLNARNNAVVNLSTNGTMYLETTLNSATDTCNNSVRYTGVQNPYVCVGYPASYNFGAFDPDGDSLSYVLIAAKSSSTTSYTYNTPYSPLVPIQGMTINTNTGTINFNPTAQGSFVVVVQVFEWDDSAKLVGISLRDIQIVVQNCLGNVAPDPVPSFLFNLRGQGVIAGPKKLEVCEGDTFCVDFIVLDSNLMDTLTLWSTNIAAVMPGATLTYSGINPIIGTLCWSVPPNANSYNIISLTVDDGFCPIPARSSFSLTIEVIKSTYASPDVTICLGDSTNILAKGGNSFNWSSISGPTLVVGTNINCDTCSPANVKPISTTIYEVVSDLSGGCNNKDSVTVTVATNFTHSLTQSAGTKCKLDPIQFDITPITPGTYTYDWSPAIMLSASNIPNPILTPVPAQSGIFNYLITIVNAQGCTKYDTISVNISNGVKPKAKAFTDKDTVHCNDFANLAAWVDTVASQTSLEDNFDTPFSPYAFLNTISGGSIGTGCGANSLPNSLNFNEPGTRMVQTSSINIGNCTQVEYALRLGNPASGFTCDNVENTDPVNFQYSTNGGATWLNMMPGGNSHNYLGWIVNTGWQNFSYPIPTGVTRAMFRWIQPNHGGLGQDNWAIDDIKITCSSLNNYSYSWSPTLNLGSPNSTTTSAQPSVGRTYQLIVTDTTVGCSDTAFVTVESKTDFPQIDISVDTTNGCKPVAVTFTNNTNPATIGTVEWNFGDGTISNSLTNPITHNYTVNGLYDISVKITSPNGCVSDTTFTGMIDIYDIPVAQFDANPQPANISNPNISFYDLSSNFAANWLWDFGINLPGYPANSTDQNPTTNYPDNTSGIYPVTLIVGTPQGCFDTVTKNIIIEGLYTLYLPTSFTPNNDGLNDVFSIKGERIDPIDFKFMIFDRWGQLVFETTNLTEGWNGKTFNEGYLLPEGVYVWKVLAKNEKTDEKNEYIGHVTMIRYKEN